MILVMFIEQFFCIENNDAETEQKKEPAQGSQ